MSAFITLKTMAFAPIAKANVTIATAVKVGVLRRIRRLRRISCKSRSSHTTVHTSRVSCFTRATLPNLHSAAVRASSGDMPRSMLSWISCRMCSWMSLSRSSSIRLRRFTFVPPSPQDEFVVLRAPIVLGCAVLDVDPSALDQPVRCRIVRTLLDLQHLVRIHVSQFDRRTFGSLGQPCSRTCTAPRFCNTVLLRMKKPCCCSHAKVTSIAQPIRRKRQRLSSSLVIEILGNIYPARSAHGRLRTLRGLEAALTPEAGVRLPQA